MKRRHFLLATTAATARIIWSNIPQQEAVATSPSPSPSQTPVEFADKEIDYFIQVAFGSEFGKQANVIRKWETDIRIKVHGADPDDKQTLSTVISELKDLTGQAIQIDDDNPSIDVYFAAQSEFKKIEPNYQPLNSGFAWVWWNDKYQITRARVLVSTTVPRKERDSIIREELTQSLGLLSDSSTYPDSIFYQEWNDVAEFSAMDKAVLRMLKLVRPGMSKNDVSKMFS